MSLLLSAALAGSINCFAAAAIRYQLPQELLYAMASVESSHNPHALARANNGTYSIGLMQINSSWFEKLEGFGLSEEALWKPCTNIQVGAWILRQEVDRYGYSWEAIGAYYAGAYTATSYAWKLPHYHAYATKVLARWRGLRHQTDAKANQPVSSRSPASDPEPHRAVPPR